MSEANFTATGKFTQAPATGILYLAGNGSRSGDALIFAPRQGFPDKRTKTPSRSGILPVPTTVFEIRRANLRHLRDGLPGDERGKQRGMAEKLGMSESQLSQLIGKRPSKRIGDRLARAIEKKNSLPIGWLDTQNHDLTHDASEIARRYQRLTKPQQALLKQLLDQFPK